jgi:mannan endo-1,4-beta-mannosidase
LSDTQHPGRHRQTQPGGLPAPIHRRWTRLVATMGAICAVAAIAVMLAGLNARHPARVMPSAPPRSGYSLPTKPSSYIGLYPDGVPESYAGVKAFAAATGVKPSVVVYYSGWAEPFKISFAMTAAKYGAIPLVQINPTGISMMAIAAGHYDSYLRGYAEVIRSFHHPVILSFGHEMNGYWYSWGYTRTSPEAFVAAWRHIVTLFRTTRVRNVTWLWTINTIHKQNRVPSPGPWWPGNSFVTWVGIDGYYLNQSSVFSSVFGPTITYVRTLTRKPIFIAETAATPAADQPAKIADLFAGVHLYDLLGFAWFDYPVKEDWRLRSSAAITAFRRNAQAYYKPASCTSTCA